MSLFALLHVGCLALLAALLIGAGVQDLRSMTIANGISLAVAGLFVVWAGGALAAGRLSSPDLAFSVGCAVVVFAAGAAAFAAGGLGGGDVKLLAAVSLFAGPARIVDFLAITAIAGGLLGLAILAGAPVGQPADGSLRSPLRARLRRHLPYGPAIAAGGLWIAATQAMS
jgi:prepilin peptidase CpaA